MDVRDIRTAYTDATNSVLEEYKNEMAQLERELDTLAAANQQKKDTDQLSALKSRLFRHRA